MTEPRNDEENVLDLRIEEARRELDELHRRLAAVDPSAAATGAASIAVLALTVAGLAAVRTSGDLRFADDRVGYIAAGFGGALLFWSLFQSVIARVDHGWIPQEPRDVAGSLYDDSELSPTELRRSVVAIHLRRIVDLGRLLRGKQRSLLVSSLELTFGAFLVTGGMLSLILSY